MVNGKSISPEDFARFILEELGNLRARPEFLDIVTEEDSNSEYVHAVASIVAQLLGNRPEVRAVGPDDLYSYNIDSFLKRGSLPFLTTPIPANGREDYFPDVQAAIKHIMNGTVIDHIVAGRGARIMNLLGLDRSDYNGRVSLGINYWSRRLGKKDFLKIESDRELGEREVDLISIVSEGATISSIREGNVTRKKTAVIQPYIRGIALCPDIGCIGGPTSYRDGRFTCETCQINYSVDEARVNSRI